jgi:hypothetical protein
LIGWAAPGALHEDAGELRRQVEAQQQDIARLQQRLQSGPLAWPAWWGWIGGAMLIGLATLAARQRRNSASPDEHALAFKPPLSPSVEPPQDHTTLPPPVEATETTAVLQPATSAAAPPPPAAVQPALPDLSARADALLTVLGEMEFLASIGLQHGAVEVMEQYMAVTSYPAPLACLELVNLHRSEGDGALATSAWHRVLALVPAAAEANPEALLDDTSGLEAYPAVLARVQAAWNTPGAAEQLAVELMATAAPLLTLSAGRDLLWLLQVCHERASARPAPAPQAIVLGDAFDCAVVLSAADWVRQLEALEVTPRDRGAGVDIELGVPDWIEEARASVRVSAPMPTPSAADSVGGLDEWRSDLFDAATGFERRRPTRRLEAAGR